MLSAISGTADSSVIVDTVCLTHACVVIIISSADCAVYISGLKCCLCVCVWMLTRVAQIVTAAALHTET